MEVFLPLYAGVPPAGYWPAWSQCGSLEGYKTQTTIEEEEKTTIKLQYFKTSVISIHTTLTPCHYIIMWLKTVVCQAKWQPQTLLLNM